MRFRSWLQGGREEELLARAALREQRQSLRPAAETSSTSQDVIVVRKEPRGSYMEFGTRVGGLLSLYSGFSALSAAELLFWAVRVVFRTRVQETQ